MMLLVKQSATGSVVSSIMRSVSHIASFSLLLAALAGPAKAQPGSRTLEDLLASASIRNLLPDSLVSYKAMVETEFRTLMRREDGSEMAFALEEAASDIRWNRWSGYHQRVKGYRSQNFSVNVSLLTMMRTGWIQPTLYGNTLWLQDFSSDTVYGGLGQRGNPNQRAAQHTTTRRDSVLAIHPLATNRSNYYRFSGGDTVVVMQVGDRVIPIVKVRAEPLERIDGRAVLFDGELDLDASSGALVRMRGYYLSRGGKSDGRRSVMADAIAYVEYENAERLGSYWLPATQRIELQAMLPVLGDNRAIIRITSRFKDMVVNDTSLSAPVMASADSLLRRRRRTLSYAPSDSLSRYRDWISSIGSLSEGMTSDDFEDVAPDRWRVTGPPRFDVVAPRLSDVVHFNRVEGLYTGAGVKWSLRDAAPGVVIRANAGYAWAEHTMRGRLEVSRKRGSLLINARGGRWMDITNDFRFPLDSGSSITALASLDAYDYVSRGGATIGATKGFGQRAAQLRAELGVLDDRYRPSQYVRGPFGGAPFRPNRGVDEGSYLKSALVFDWHPGAAAEFVSPGVGVRVSYERGDGTLSWQRMEARISGRRTLGPFTLIGRGDVGQVLGSRIPAQQLFELGKYQNLPGYVDKEFAGSRAAVLRAGLQYQSPFLGAPIRLGSSFWLPAPSPGLSVGLQSGWTDAPTLAARESIYRLGTVTSTDIEGNTIVLPVSRPTDGVRASVSAGMRFFGGGVFAGWARAVDHPEPWKFLVAFGQAW